MHRWNTAGSSYYLHIEYGSRLAGFEGSGKVGIGGVGLKSVGFWLLGGFGLEEGGVP